MAEFASDDHRNPASLGGSSACCLGSFLRGAREFPRARPGAHWHGQRCIGAGEQGNSHFTSSVCLLDTREVLNRSAGNISKNIFCIWLVRREM